MKFITDAQLPIKLSTFFRNKGFDCIHTKFLPNKNATTDQKITELSLAEKRIVITKDSDFYNRYLTKLEPYKLILISTGNIKTDDLISIFEKNLDRVLEEIQHNFVLELTSKSLITIL